MPEVTIKFAFLLSRKLAASQVTIKGKNKFTEIISSLKEQLKDKFSELVDHNGELQRSFVFMLNDKVVSREELSGIEFKDKDVLRLFLPLAGG